MSIVPGSEMGEALVRAALAVPRLAAEPPVMGAVPGLKRMLQFEGLQR